MDKLCRTCQFWKPSYHGVGECRKEGSMNSKFWIADEKGRLLTVGSFSCQSYEPQADIGKETL